MFVGPSYQRAPKYYVHDEELTLRPYNARLTELTAKICADIRLDGNDACHFETRTAFDCLLRHKARKMGSITDNLGACSHHITNMKDNLGKEAGVLRGFESVLDSRLEELNFSTKSFV